MNLPNSQTGVLVEQVQAGSPADTAGLQGSFKPALINGQRVLVGGDVITAIDGKTVTTFDDLLTFMQTAKPGQQVTLAILRDGKQQTLTAIANATSIRRPPSIYRTKEETLTACLGSPAISDQKISVAFA